MKVFEISQGLQDNQNEVMSGIAGLSSQLSSVESNILNTLNASVAAPVLAASSFLGGVFLPGASTAVAQGLGMALFVLIIAAVLVSTAVLIRQRQLRLAN